MLDVYAWQNLQCVHGSMTPKLSDMDIDFWTDHISQVPLLLDWIYFPVNAWAAMIARSKQCWIALLLGWGPVIVFPSPKLQHYHFAFNEARGKWKLIGDVHLAHRLWNMISSLERRMADQIPRHGLHIQFWHKVCTIRSTGAIITNKTYNQRLCPVLHISLLNMFFLLHLQLVWRLQIVLWCKVCWFISIS